MPASADIIILGGLSVTVNYWSQPAEPDVGIFNSWVEDFEITHVRRKDGKWAKIKGTKFAKALEARCKADEVCQIIQEQEF